MSILSTALTHRAVKIRRMRKRNPEIVHLATKIPVQIREIDASEMKTVARVRYPLGTEVSFTAYEGQFFIAALDFFGNEPIAGDKIHEYFSARLRHSGGLPAFSWLPEGGERAHPTVASTLPEELSDDVVEVLSDDESERSLDVTRQMDGFVVVDGALWRRTPEPTWNIQLDPGRFPVSLTAGDPNGYPGHLTFRLDRAADAERYAKSLCSNLRRVWKGVPPTAEIDGVVLKRDDRLHAAAGLAGHFVDLLPQGWLRFMSKDDILGWASLRDTVAAPGSWGAGSADTFIAESSKLLAALDRLSLNRQGAEDRAAAKKKMFNVLARWTEFEGGTLNHQTLDAGDEAALAGMGASR